ncbi:hypothetical protein HY469_00305 [Candidatus Roizmanbacteria bacterium]|nr:hypothetical protein [Candidatus Roizmanbacteria bacterium]
MNTHCKSIFFVFLLLVSFFFSGNAVQAAQIIQGTITMERVDPLGGPTVETSVPAYEGGLVNFWYSYLAALDREDGITVFDVAYNYRTTRLYADGRYEDISTKGPYLKRFVNPTLADVQNVKGEAYIDPACVQVPNVAACGLVIKVWEQNNEAVIPALAWGDYTPFPAALGSVMINLPAINTVVGAPPTGLSALAYNASVPPQPIFSGITYEWGISSTGSIGSVNPVTSNVTNFTPLSAGTGDLFVTARLNSESITNSIQLIVTNPTPTPTTIPVPTGTVSWRRDVTVRSAQTSQPVTGAQVAATGLTSSTCTTNNSGMCTITVTAHDTGSVTITVTAANYQQFQNSYPGLPTNGSLTIDLQSSPSNPGDVNKDNHVNISDLSILLSAFGTSNANADFNNDGKVGIADLAVLLSNFGLSF